MGKKEARPTVDDLTEDAHALTISQVAGFPFASTVRHILMICTLTATSLSVSCQSSSVDYVRQVRFDARVWQEAEASEQRLAMVRDLQKAYLKGGLSRDAIIRLLGKRTKEIAVDRAQGIDGVGGKWMYYHMGWPREMHDGCYLVVVLDGKGHFVCSSISESW